MRTGRPFSSSVVRSQPPPFVTSTVTKSGTRVGVAAHTRVMNGAGEPDSQVGVVLGYVLLGSFLLFFTYPIFLFFGMMLFDAIKDTVTGERKAREERRQQQHRKRFREWQAQAPEWEARPGEDAALEAAAA